MHVSNAVAPDVRTAPVLTNVLPAKQVLPGILSIQVLASPALTSIVPYAQSTTCALPVQPTTLRMPTVYASVVQWRAVIDVQIMINVIHALPALPQDTLFTLTSSAISALIVIVWCARVLRLALVAQPVPLATLFHQEHVCNAMTLTVHSVRLLIHAPLARHPPDMYSMVLMAYANYAQIPTAKAVRPTMSVIPAWVHRTHYTMGCVDYAQLPIAWCVLPMMCV